MRQPENKKVGGLGSRRCQPREFAYEIRHSGFRAFWTSSLLVLLLLSHLFIAPAAVQAQDTDWIEKHTQDFTILYTADVEDKANEYAGFADGIYDEIAALFGEHIQRPIALRLFSTQDAYVKVNPAARFIEGVVAHADFRQHEVAVVIPGTQNQSKVEVINNIRHELTHIFLSELSQNRLNTGFQEGIAQFVEQPSDELTRKIELLRDSYDAGSLLKWSDFDNRDTVYGAPRISYPEALSVVAFLVEQYGFDKLREFVTISGRSSGYRSALERTYNMPPADLEEQWRKWLPNYLTNTGHAYALSSYDLAHVRRLLELGHYDEAQKELTEAVNLINAAGDRLEDGTCQRLLGDASTLSSQIEQGAEAERSAQEAHSLLQEGRYDQAAPLIVRAEQNYAAIGDTRQSEVLSSYRERAERGQQAIKLLSTANDFAQQFRLPEARTAASQAALQFAAIEDKARQSAAEGLSQALEQRQALISISLGALGLGALLITIFRRRTPQEQDLW